MQPAERRAVPGRQLVLDPATGTAATPVQVTTTVGCRAGTNLQVRVLGAGFEPDSPGGTGGTNITANLPQEDASSPLVVPLQQTFETLALQQRPPVQLAGEYEVRLVCRSRLVDDNLGDFRLTVAFTRSAGEVSYRTQPRDGTVPASMGGTSPGPTPSAAAGSAATAGTPRAPAADPSDSSAAAAATGAPPDPRGAASSTAAAGSSAPDPPVGVSAPPAPASANSVTSAATRPPAEGSAPSRPEVGPAGSARPADDDSNEAPLLLGVGAAVLALAGGGLLVRGRHSGRAPR